MKRYIIIITVLVAGAFALNGCDDTRTVYNGQPFVMFADTMSVCPAMQDGQEFPVYIATLNTRDYDRTYGVEIVAGASNAVYGYHYKLDTQTVTIPAGKTSAVIHVQPIYENIENTDSLGLQLNLVSALGDEWSEQGSTTKILLQKVCPFEIHDFTGYCRITSDFLHRFLGYYSHVFTSEIVEGEENTLLLRGFFQKGYNLKIRFDGTDPLNPRFVVDEGQVVGDTRDLMGAPYGDCQLLAAEVPGLVPTVDVCRKTAVIPLILYINNVGSAGGFYNIVEWIGEYEAD